MSPTSFGIMTDIEIGIRYVIASGVHVVGFHNTKTLPYLTKPYIRFGPNPGIHHQCKAPTK